FALQDGEQRVLCNLGVEIEYQSVLVFPNRFQGEDLWGHRLLEIEYQTDDAGAVLPHAYPPDVGVVGANLRHKLIESAVQCQPVNVNNETVGAIEHEVFGLQLSVHFQGDTRVFVRWPGADRHDTGGMSHPGYDRDDKKR